VLYSVANYINAACYNLYKNNVTGRMMYRMFFLGHCVWYKT